MLNSGENQEPRDRLGCGVPSDRLGFLVLGLRGKSLVAQGRGESLVSQGIVDALEHLVLRFGVALSRFGFGGCGFSVEG